MLEGHINYREEVAIVSPTIPDLRDNYDQARLLESGTLYRRDNVVQVWWHTNTAGEPFVTPEKGRETWTFNSINQAVESFNDFEE